MTNLEKIAYWKDISNYDLDTANVMLKGKRFLYVGYKICTSNNQTH